MSEKVSAIASKIVSASDATGGNGRQAWVVCEDGSMWLYALRDRSWWQIHPPYEKPTHAADLAEVLDALKKLNDVDIDDEYGVQQAIFKNADRVLQKHGMQVYQPPNYEV